MKTRWKQRKEKRSTNGTLLDQILSIRGIDQNERERFLNPSLESLYDPSLIPDMDKAVERILKAIKKNEKIVIYSDYDCDGTLGAAILIRFLREIGAKVDYYIPNRLKEGYGLNAKAIEMLDSNGTDLIITVDNGIASCKEAVLIKKRGIDLVITDHHEPQAQLPDALAILDCKRKDSKYPYRELCGAAVVLKLVMQLSKVLGRKDNFDEFFEMAMIALIADVVPLIDENRVLVQLGFKAFREHGFTHQGLAKLYELTGIDELSSSSIGYRLAPIINAAGRLGEVEEVMDFLLDEKIDLAEKLFKKNVRRTEIEKKLFNEVVSRIKTEKLYQEDIIVVGGDGWHTGVLGIVASRIQEIWYKPVILIGFDENGLGRGSCRSIKNFNIFKALSSAQEIFESFGGHSQAAGFSIKRENLPNLIKNLRAYTSQFDMKALSIYEYSFDLETEISSLNQEEIEELKTLEPYGIGNPAPVFKLKVDKISNVRCIGTDNKHLSFYADNVRAIGFNMAKEHAILLTDDCRILAKAEINCYNNRKNLQLNLKDVKENPNISFLVADKLFEDNTSDNIYEELIDYQRIPSMSRKHLVVVYNLIRKKPTLHPGLYTSRTGESMVTLAGALHILKEACLIDYTYLDGSIVSRVIPCSEKKDLTQTPTYQLLKQVRMKWESKENK